MLKWFRFCSNFDHYREIAELRGKLAAAEQTVSVQEKRITELFDWMLKFNGIGLSPQPETQSIEKKTLDPFHLARNGRDFQRIANDLENSAIGPIDFAKKA